MKSLLNRTYKTKTNLYNKLKALLLKAPLDKRTRWHCLIINFLVILIIAFIDFLVGPEPFFPFLYAVPVIFIAWFVSRIEGTIFAIISTIISVLLEYHFIPELTVWMAIWSNVTSFSLFLLMVQLFSLQKTALVKEKQISKVRNELLGMASHDILNPISCISLYTELIREEAEKKSLNECVSYTEEITNLCSYTTVLLKEILEYSEMESGTVKLILSTVEYNKRVKEIITLYRLIAKKKNISIVHRLSDKDILLNIDTHKIDQVLSNIITNSIKYSNPDTKVVVEVIDNGNTIDTKVIDNGIGIPQNEIDKVFLPFRKTKSKPTGGEMITGLGLAIVKRIIDAHKGNITIESKIDYGTTFTFSLPKNMAYN